MPERFLSANPHFAKSALSRYTQWDFIGLVDDYGIAWHEKTLGQLFCDNSAKDIIAMLRSEMDKAKAQLWLQTSVTDINHDGTHFQVTLEKEGRTVTEAFKNLERLRALDQSRTLVFLPNHRSYLDPFVLRQVLGAAGFPPNHILGGVNLSFFPLGSIARRSNIVFIRRQFRDAPVYRAMLSD